VVLSDIVTKTYIDYSGSCTFVMKSHCLVGPEHI